MINKNEINYKLIKSKAYKKITISIKKTQKIVVSAPKNVSNFEIEKFVKANRIWILNNIKKMELNEKSKKHSFENYDKFKILGETFELKIEKADFTTIFLDKINKIIFIKSKNVSPNNIKKIIISYYKKETKALINYIINNNPVYNKITLNVSSIKVHKANTRWGSCSSKNNLNFSYRLFMLPIDCIEYVIAHELAHIKVKNHSELFYLEVQNIFPNFKNVVNKMKEFEFNNNLTLD